MTTMCSAGRDLGHSDDQSRLGDERLTDEKEERLRLEAEILRRAARELAGQRAKTPDRPLVSEEATNGGDQRRADEELRSAEDLVLSADLSSSSSSADKTESDIDAQLPVDRSTLVTLILDEESPHRRREMAAELARSATIRDAINDLNGAARDQIYLAFSLLFLIAKTGEIQPLLQAIEDHPSLEVRLEVIKLLTLTREPHVRPAFRDLSAQSSLPFEVQSAIMDALDQIPGE